MLSNCSSNFELNSVGDEVTAFMHACENGHKVVVNETFLVIFKHCK